MKLVYQFLGCIAIFLAGLVSEMQLDGLVVHNPNYEASWWKFGFAVAWAAACSVLIIMWPHRD